jgi:hypothetical protein
MARAFVMPEDEWFKLCARACRVRRKEHGNDRAYCAEHDGICPECASDAARAVPAKYRTTEQRAATFGLLPGLEAPRG